MINHNVIYHNVGCTQYDLILITNINVAVFAVISNFFFLRISVFYFSLDFFERKHNDEKKHVSP